MDYCLNDYELVGVDPDIRIPPRSILASLKPRGMGTPFRESLSSYYLALAHMHQVSPKILARELIIPLLKFGNEKIDKDNFILWKLPLFNGMGMVPEKWAELLSELTGQKDLIDLTLVPLRPYTNMQRLTSRSKKWCPLCLSEAAQEGRAYGQLLWEIDAVEACPKHGIRLVNRCGCETESQSKRNIMHLSGFCDLCGRSLTQDNKDSIENASEDELTRARLVAQLLDDMERLKLEAPVGISEFLKNAVYHFAGGNSALFGRLLGIKKNTLHGWMHGKSIPTFPQLVEIAFACRCSIADVILGTQATFENSELVNVRSRPWRPFRTKEAQMLDRELVKQQLELLVNESPPISVATAAKRIGISRRTLFRDFGKIAKKISRRFREYRHSERMRKFDHKCNLYHQSAMRLAQQGIRPTPKLVGLDIKGKRIIIKGYERTVCNNICRDAMQRNQSR